MIEPRAGVRNISPYTPGEPPELDFDRVINIANNESPYGASPAAVEAAVAALQNGLQLYPDPGCTALRRAIAEVHEIEADQIICSNGSEELLQLIAKAYAKDGDEIIMSQYGFLMFPVVAHAVGATPIAVEEDDCIANVDAIIAAVTEKTRIVFLANPNNPTGTYIPRDELKRLRDGLPADVLLVLDCAYAEYAVNDDYDNGMAYVNDGADNTLVARTFSKIYGLAASRVGWAYCPAPVADVLHRVRGVFNVGGPSQAAAAAAVRDQEFVASVRTKNLRELAKVSAGLGNLGLSVLPSQCNFVLARFPDAAAASDTAGYLASKGIFVRPVANYGLDDCLRITIGAEEENQILLAVLAEFFASKSNVA